MHALRTPDETRMIRTVHQAKGAEAAAVFVVLEDEQVGHILRPIPNNEEQRITYVALSRAQDELFIYCPSVEHLHGFEAAGLSTMIVGTQPEAASAKKKRQTRPMSEGR